MQNLQEKRGSKWSKPVNLERILVQIERVWAHLSQFSSSSSAKAVQNDHMRQRASSLFSCVSCPLRVISPSQEADRQGGRGMALLEVEGLDKFYGRRKVVKGVSFDGQRRRGRRAARPQRGRQDDQLPHGDRARSPPTTARSCSTARTSPALPMYQRARRGMGYLSQEPSVFRKLTVEKNLLAILEALPRSRSLGRRLTSRSAGSAPTRRCARFKLDHVRKNTAGPLLRRREAPAGNRPLPRLRAAADPARRAVRRRRPDDDRGHPPRTSATWPTRASAS